MSELGLHQIGHISFGREYEHSTVSQMAYELENYFSRYEYHLDVISHKKLRMGVGNRYRMRDPVTWKVAGIPLHKNVDIIGYGKVNGNDFRPYYTGDCEVFVDDVSVFKGNLKESAKIMHEKSREIALEARQMTRESVRSSNIIEIRQILGDPLMDQLVSENPSQKEEIIYVMRALSACVKDDSFVSNNCE